MPAGTRIARWVATVCLFTALLAAIGVFFGGGPGRGSECTVCETLPDSIVSLERRAA